MRHEGLKMKRLRLKEEALKMEGGRCRMKNGIWRLEGDWRLKIEDEGV